jgi:hypothetical protein
MSVPYCVPNVTTSEMMKVGLSVNVGNRLPLRVGCDFEYMVVGIDKLKQQHFAISHYGCLGLGLRIIGGINPRFCDYQACGISTQWVIQLKA